MLAKPLGIGGVVVGDNDPVPAHSDIALQGSQEGFGEMGGIPIRWQ